ncbi:MAG TPA: cysteine desulfurase family protein [Candidatus Cloacimonadota bacterium]|nr:cysteine desulfurase family protein [Candidatus Cloacimonadota bacterium]
MKKYYFDNCKTTQPAPEVIEAMLPYLKEKFVLPANFVLGGSTADEELAGFKKTVAASIGAKPEEIHFTASGTLANNIAIKGFISENAGNGTHIIVSVIDYPDLLTNAAFFEKSGFDVTYLGTDSEGFIDLEQLKNSLRSDTILFMTTFVNHTVGSIQPLKKIREILDTADHKIALHVDAGQAYGKIPIAVNELGIDLMSFSAHKIHGPQGVGALYQRKGVQLGPVIHGINRLDNHQTGMVSLANIAGFAKAVELAFGNFDANVKKLRELSNYLLERIESTIPYTLLNGPRGEGRTPHNINISFDFIEGEAIMLMLDLAGISVDTGSACASQGLKPNYILMAMGRNHEQSHSSMKFTMSRYNTKEEIDYAVDKLAEIVKELRRRSPLYKEK